MTYNRHMETIVALHEPQQQIDALTAQVTELSDKLAKMQTLIDYYEHQFKLMKRKQFGVSSERAILDTADYRQMGLMGEAAAVANSIPEPEREDITYTRKKRVGKREEDLSNLPVERIDHEMPESERSCPQCGETMSDIGVDVRRELKLIPAKVVVVEHATHAYACAGCQKNSENTPIVKADAPAPLISGSLASPSLVAHIAVQKYSNGMPLYRLEKGFIYDSVNISRQTMSNWVVKCVEMFLYVIYGKLIENLLLENTLHADETTVQVLHEPDRDATQKSYEWVYRTGRDAGRQIVVYDYQETREQAHPQTFLKDYKGLLHTDGYQVYHKLPLDIIIIGCWAHVRREWEKFWKSIPKEARKDSEAERGLRYINELFDLERDFKKLTPDERYKERLEKSKPVADAFFGWVEGLGALPKSPLGKPVTYTLSQQKYLENVFLDGRAEISNNRCERSVKRFVMGRKAWLFSNTPGGAVASSIMYSIIETAKENGLHPYYYMKYLLEVLPSSTTENVDDFLPWSQNLPMDCRVPVKVAKVNSNSR